MALIDYFLRRRKRSASVAKERLQIILAREHANRDGPDYLPAMQKELLAVVCRYVDVDMEQVEVKLDTQGDCEILELNITLPDPIGSATHAVR